MQPNYLASIKEHINECLYELDQISELSQKKSLTKVEYYAAERILQVLVEAAIGLAKQWVKELGHPAPSDAYESFIVLHDEKKVTSEELEQWKKIIGLRNALVHDYLNLDRRIIDRIIQRKLYHFVSDFVNQYSK